MCKNTMWGICYSSIVLVVGYTSQHELHAPSFCCAGDNHNEWVSRLWASGGQVLGLTNMPSNRIIRLMGFGSKEVGWTDMPSNNKCVLATAGNAGGQQKQVEEAQFMDGTKHLQGLVV